MTLSFIDQDYLEIRGLTVDFDGFKAVNGVDLTLLQGRPALSHRSERRRQDNARGRAHRTCPQLGRGHVPEPEPVDHEVAHDRATRDRPDVPNRVSVRSNSACCRTSTSPPEYTAKQADWSFARRKVPDSVEQALETIGLTALAHRPAGILAHGQKQWLEVGMLLVQDAKVMFLDETVAGMSAHEREETGDLLKRIAGDRTIVVIEHDMEFMRRYADFVTVMHSGTVLAEGTVAEIQADQKVQEVYLGTATGVAAHG